MARYLVTGGAGYVGSHVVLALLDRGDEVVVLDNLSTGHRAAVAPGAEFVKADLACAKDVAEVFAGWRFDAVFHLAALSLVGESMRQPLHYVRANVNNSVGLAEAALVGLAALEVAGHLAEPAAAKAKAQLVLHRKSCSFYMVARTRYHRIAQSLLFVVCSTRHFYLFLLASSFSFYDAQLSNLLRRLEY